MNFSVVRWIRFRETRLAWFIRRKRRRDPRPYFEAVEAIFHPR